MTTTFSAHAAKTATIALVSTLTFSMAAVAAPTQAPDAFVKGVADALVAKLVSQRAAYKKDPKVLTTIVQQNIEPYVDFNGFANGVMGKYARVATPAQKARFSIKFKEALLRTYTNGLAAYDNQSYTIRPYTAGTNPEKAVVSMDFKTNQGTSIPVSYQMVQSGNTWKIRNLVLNGINIGLTFQNEFAATVQKYNGNLDKAIDNFIPPAPSDVKK